MLAGAGAFRGSGKTPGDALAPTPALTVAIWLVVPGAPPSGGDDAGVTAPAAQAVQLTFTEWRETPIKVSKQGVSE